MKLLTKPRQAGRATGPLGADTHRHRGLQKAEVTLGVDTKALSQQTMECKAQPGLYFIGEVVDITGWLGGYNFQWAAGPAAWPARRRCQGRSEFLGRLQGPFRQLRRQLLPFSLKAL